MPKAKQSGLAAVQNLYITQLQLQKHLDTGLRTPEQIKEAKECLKEFSSLLSEVDPQYMGGEDVLDGLHSIHEKMSERVKKHARKKKSAKKGK